ncbi:NAD-dependent epimerase/dehydratase family protein [Fimbriiglobus ruber]|nr:NAD(P)-dependent oxidoreductase [Fimbriiglobus ruber]
MSQPQRVLVTGSAGRVGRAAVKGLTAAGHHVVGFDRVPTPGLPPAQSLVAPLSDVAALRAAVADGVDCVIHLAAAPDDAAFPRKPPPDDGDNFLSDLVPSNLVGPYHVMEAVRTAGVRRVILASTGQVVDGHLRSDDVPVTATMLPRPRYLYACTKVFLEALGQVYATQHGITVLAVRLGWCPRDLGQVAEIRASHLGQDVFFSPGDVGRFFAAAVGAEKLPQYAVVYAGSRPVHNMRYDLDAPRKLFGYEPQDQWPTGAEEF